MLPTLCRNPLSLYQECAPGFWCFQWLFEWIAIITHVPFVIFLSYLCKSSILQLKNALKILVQRQFLNKQRFVHMKERAVSETCPDLQLCPLPASPQKECVPV